MAPATNPFVRAAAEAEAARFALAAADDFARFFAGDLAELQLRWGLTAVEFNDGQYIVPLLAFSISAIILAENI